MTTKLELYSDYVCPWCYFMTGRIERLYQNFDISISWRAFPLHPETPEQGQKLEEIYARYPYPTKDMLEHLRRNARALNLPYCERTMTFNSRLAQELGHWAEEQGAGEPFHAAAFKAYFVDHQNLAKRDVLISLIEAAGLDVDEGVEVLEKRSYSDAVDRDWERSRALGITAVPTFVIGEAKLVGAQQYRALAQFAEAHGVAQWAR